MSNDTAERIPTFTVKVTDHGLFRFWCTHCRRHHTHGSREGHRAAHCDPGSPYNSTGYILKRPTA